MPSDDHLHVDGNTPLADCDHIKLILHTEAVSNFIQSQSPNRILNRTQPRVAAEEELLPPQLQKHTLSTPLEALCPEWYGTDIDLTNDLICLSYSSGTQDTPHLFICLSNSKQDLCLGDL